METLAFKGSIGRDKLCCNCSLHDVSHYVQINVFQTYEGYGHNCD